MSELKGGKKEERVTLQLALLKRALATVLIRHRLKEGLTHPHLAKPLSLILQLPKMGVEEEEVIG